MAEDASANTVKSKIALSRAIFKIPILLTYLAAFFSFLAAFLSAFFANLRASTPL
jgi:hypothetical protein